MSSWPDQPVIWEVNTAAWLRELGGPAGGRRRLDDVSAAEWDALLPPGVDAVWLMGVWERSPAGVAIALGNAGLRSDFRAALGDVTDADVAGSPYCVRSYTVDPAFGGDEGLAAARAELARRGLRLLVDYVPNHVAPDHAWTTEHPDLFVHGSGEDARAHPEAYLAVGGAHLAHGRDPYFPPWPDVVQLNAFEPRLRQATASTLAAIGDRADGVRCDMAMLMMNAVFSRTWGESAGPEPATDFWPEVLAQVRATHPGMVFVAEAYWDLEWDLQQQGFDFCYDKRLYDRLVHEDAGAVRAHLGADPGYQHRLVRFLENHDEPRAAAVMDKERERAAAVVIATLPGATLWHQGQLAGRRVRLPVFLDRWPDEPVDPDLLAFHERLLAATEERRVRAGEWALLGVEGWPDNDSANHLLSWSWGDATHRAVVVVNLAAQASQGRVALPWPDLEGRWWRLTDIVSPGATFDRDGGELAAAGLYVDLPPWGYNVFAVGEIPVFLMRPDPTHAGR